MSRRRRRRQKQGNDNQEKKQWCMIGRGWEQRGGKMSYSLDLDRLEEVMDAYCEHVVDNGYMRVYEYDNERDGDHDVNLVVALPEGTIEFDRGERNETGASRARRNTQEKADEQERRYRERKPVQEPPDDSEIPY